MTVTTPDGPDWRHVERLLQDTQAKRLILDYAQSAAQQAQEQLDVCESAYQAVRMEYIACRRRAIVALCRERGRGFCAVCQRIVGVDILRTVVEHRVSNDLDDTYRQHFVATNRSLPICWHCSTGRVFSTQTTKHGRVGDELIDFDVDLHDEFVMQSPPILAHIVRTLGINLPSL